MASKLKVTRKSTVNPRRSTRRTVKPISKSRETEDKKNRVENTVVKRKRPFKCSLCQKVFVVQASLRRHFKKKHPNEYKIYKYCYLCDKKFSSINELISHLRTHKKEKLYKCPTCPAGFLDTRNLVLHQQIHSEDKYKCPLCEKTFATFRYMMKHKSFFHVDVLPYKCTFCEAGFKRFSTQKKHERIHTGEQKKTYKCSFCEKSFGDNHHRKRHENTVHLKIDVKERKHICPICEVVLSCRDSLKNHHNRMHLKEKPHVCNFCDKRFSIYKELEHHITTHTKEKPHKCPICHRGFAGSDNVRMHMPTHSKDRLYKCSLCKQSFKTARYRTIHIRNIHNNGCLYKKPSNDGSENQGQTAENICKCSHCKKGSGNRSFRRRTEETPYKCSVCQKSFRTNWYKGVHEKNHYLKKSIQPSNLCKNTPETEGSARTRGDTSIGIKPKPSTSETMGSARTRGITLTGEKLKPSSSETTGSARTRGRTPTGEIIPKPSTSAKRSLAPARNRIKRFIGFQHTQKFYSCTTCLKYFVTYEQLLSHRKTHKILRPCRVIVLRFA